MKMSTLTMLLALTPLAVACAPDEPEAEDAAERTAVSASALLGGSKLLWPMKDGKATIKVCWLPVDLGDGVAPGGEYATDFTKAMVERRQWIREGVEREWNAKTVVQFVGWEDCGVAGADVKIQPIASRGAMLCLDQPGTGGWCVERIGAPVRGRRVFINSLFGDEALGEARYLQSLGNAALDRSKLVAGGVQVPGICTAEMSVYASRYNDRQPITAADLANMARVYKDCLQNQANHEFGHLAGFSHEQNRKDTPAACRERAPAGEPFEQGDEDSPLGGFDSDSIMSYCRVTLAPTLTAQDVKEVNAFYEKLAPKLAPTTPASSGETDASDSEDADVVTKPKPPRNPKPVGSPSTGGCNG